MDTFLKATAGVLITALLCLTLSKQSKDFSLLLAIAVCCMVAAAAVEYLKPVLDFFEKLVSIGQLDSEMLAILLKATGMGLLTEIASLICTDAGNATLGKTLQILASAIILWLSVPLLTSLIELVENILSAA